jgi:class 3 adenylate cyclase
MNDEFNLERFGRDVPHILEKQLIANLAEQFLKQETETEDFVGCFTNLPSIVHFHGALLFIDISGFTVLSQRLPVDELRTQINAYFKKILDIVEKHGGDVVKFAGDALFIIWQTPLDRHGTFLISILIF